MFPTIKQYKNWSLPSKYAFWGLFLVGIPSLAIGVYQLFPHQSVSKNIDQYIYTPKVRLTSAKLLKWIGDSEPYLTLFFENKSKGPADKFKAYVYDRSKKVMLTKISKSNMMNNGNLRISPGQDLGIPLIAMSDLDRIVLGEKMAKSIVGVGLTASLPPYVKQVMDKKYIKHGIGRYSTRSYPLIVKYSYGGITDVKKTSNAFFYVYIDDTINK